MRLIDADELIEHVWRDRLDSRELIAKMVESAPTAMELSGKLIVWAYCRDLNDINTAILLQDEDWEGLRDASQIISITYDSNHGCYVVFWTVERSV